MVELNLITIIIVIISTSFPYHRPMSLDNMVIGWKSAKYVAFP